MRGRSFIRMGYDLYSRRHLDSDTNTRYALTDERTKPNAQHTATPAPVPKTRAHHPDDSTRRRCTAGWPPLQPASPDPPVPPGLERPTTSTCAYHAVTPPPKHLATSPPAHSRSHHLPRYHHP